MTVASCAVIIGQAVRFAAVGGLNTLVGFGTILFGMEVLSLSPVVANLLGYGVGIVLSFVLHRRVTFRHRGAVLPALARFALCIAVAYGCNLATLLFLINDFAIPPVQAQFAAVVVYTGVSFILSRTFVFAARHS